MGSNTSIEWTEATWNPFAGCTRRSPGCDNCYAIGINHRFSKPGMYGEGLTVVRQGRPDWRGATRVREQFFGRMVRSRKPKMVFVNSMSDTFHHGFSDDEIARVFAEMRDAPQHTFQVLTKRADRLPKFFASEAGREFEGLPNVWIGVSAENQEYWDKRVPYLGDVKAAVRFVSAEPMLGPIRLGEGAPVDWVIIGGESGAGARPSNIRDMIKLVVDCAHNNVACFVKQLGSRPEDGAGIKVLGLTGKANNMDEWDSGWGLSVRQWPTPASGDALSGP